MPARHTRLSPSAVQSALGEALAELRRSLELPDSFPPEVVAEAEEVAASDAAVDGSDAERADLRDLAFLTIDPEGSRDLDQAMHIARAGDGFVVHYAIADLAAFVRPGGAIDAEARRRGQTLYAPDGSIPRPCRTGPRRSCPTRTAAPMCGASRSMPRERTAPRT